MYCASCIAYRYFRLLTFLHAVSVCSCTPFFCPVSTWKFQSKTVLNPYLFTPCCPVRLVAIQWQESRRARLLIRVWSECCEVGRIFFGAMICSAGKVNLQNRSGIFLDYFSDCLSVHAAQDLATVRIVSVNQVGGRVRPRPRISLLTLKGSFVAETAPERPKVRFSGLADRFGASRENFPGMNFRLFPTFFLEPEDAGVGEQSKRLKTGEGKRGELNVNYGGRRPPRANH